MNPRFLAVCLWVIAAGFAAGLAGILRDTARDRKPILAAQACAVVLLMIAVLANAGADLWLTGALARRAQRMPPELPAKPEETGTT